jgi:hypothetical protein
MLRSELVLSLRGDVVLQSLPNMRVVGCSIEKFRSEASGQNFLTRAESL